MIENRPHFLKRALKWSVLRLLKVSSLRFAVVFLIVAVIVSVMIVLTIDFLWDGQFNPELEFAGVLTPFLDGLFLVVFIIAMFNEMREEEVRRKMAEDQLRKLNDELDAKVKERTRQLLEAQEELVRKELAVLAKIADSVGHELRNPLGVMKNAVYFLQAVLTDADETTKEYLGIMNDEIDDAERIVADLLDAVRTKSPHREMSEVRDIIETTLRKCDVPVSVSVRLDFQETLPAILVDQVQMRQVFWNLITNGVEAMPDGGELEIRAYEDAAAKTVTVDIKDNGSGIAPENRDSLFQPMFTTKPRRIGLGLAVVKNLTEANGGSVRVQSEQGKGSTFSVTLPGNGPAASIA